MLAAGLKAISVNQYGPPSKSLGARIQSIDLLRGIVMIIMALDHTRDFFHEQAFTGDPLNLSTTTPILFFTRWITHFCAPVFIFLSGTSIYLQSLRKTKAQLSIFLVKRGLWLILIEVLVMSFAFTFDPSYKHIFLQTIWAIGISMVLLAIFIWLPFRLILLLGLLIVLGHNTLDFAEASSKSPFGFWWSMFHRQNAFPLGDGRTLFNFYPFLPWTGLMLLGYCTGKLYRQRITAEYRSKVLFWLGLALICFFIALRLTNLYGDPSKYNVQGSWVYTILSFINTTKYPPSLLYMCMTIGPALILLSWVEKIQNSVTNVFVIFGRVPFLFYVLHFYLLHLLCMGLFLLRGHSFTEGMNTTSIFKFINIGEGYRLMIVYMIWIGVVVLLYPLCKKFSEYKQTHKQWWLSYL